MLKRSLTKTAVIPTVTTTDVSAETDATVMEAVTSSPQGKRKMTEEKADQPLIGNSCVGDGGFGGDKTSSSRKEPPNFIEKAAKFAKVDGEGEIGNDEMSTDNG